MPDSITLLWQKICSISEMETMSREGTRGAEEHYYTQKITARILNGAYKGKEITLSNEYTSSQVQTQKYHKGDTVLLNGSKDRPGKTIRSVKRDIYLVVLVGGLIILLIYITRKQGGLYDRISDTEYIDFCVRISTVGRWKEYSENM